MLSPTLRLLHLYFYFIVLYIPFQTIWTSLYPMKVIPETCRVH